MPNEDLSLLEPTAVETEKVLNYAVPTYIASSHQQFVQCPNCSQIYWPGTHWTHMLSRLQELMGRSAAGATVGVAEAVSKGGVSTNKELLINAIPDEK